MVTSYRRRRDIVVGRLTELDVKAFPPCAAFHAWVDVADRAGLGAWEFALRLLARTVPSPPAPRSAATARARPDVRGASEADLEEAASALPGWGGGWPPGHLCRIDAVPRLGAEGMRM